MNQDWNRPTAWQEKGAQGSAEEACERARSYLEAQDYEKAEQYFREAYAKGCKDALPGLGFVCLRSDDKKVQAEGLDYVRQAAENGDKYSFYLLGLCHRMGIGTEIDVDEAVKAWEHAVEHGVPQAYYNLGLLYETGKGVQRDYAKALALYKYADANGIEQARPAILRTEQKLEDGTE